MKKHEFHAVHEYHVEELLKRLELWDDLINGELNCDICECQLNEENFGGLFPLDGEIKLYCDKQDCYQEVLMKKGKKGD